MFWVKDPHYRAVTSQISEMNEIFFKRQADYRAKAVSQKFPKPFTNFKITTLSHFATLRKIHKDLKKFTRGPRKLGIHGQSLLILESFLVPNIYIFFVSSTRNKMIASILLKLAVSNFIESSANKIAVLGALIAVREYTRNCRLFIKCSTVYLIYF